MEWMRGPSVAVANLSLSSPAAPWTLTCSRILTLSPETSWLPSSELSSSPSPRTCSSVERSTFAWTSATECSATTDRWATAARRGRWLRPVPIPIRCTRSQWRHSSKSITMIRPTKVTLHTQIVLENERRDRVNLAVFADAINELELKLKQLQIANQKLARNSRGSAVLVEKETVSYSNDGQRATVEDVTKLTKIQQGASTESGGATLPVASVLATLLVVLTLRRCL